MPPVPPLAALPAVPVDRVELVVLELPVVAPLVAAHGAGDPVRPVLLVHVVGDGVGGWAECPVEPTPAYDGWHTAGELAALRDEVVPLTLRAGLSDWSHVDASAWRRPGVAAFELAMVDAQLRAAGRSLASWLGATVGSVPAGATVGLAPDPGAVAVEAEGAVAAGARRVRVKVQPGQAVEPLRAVRAAIGSSVSLQADANGSFTEGDAELLAIDELGLACLEQPLSADDLDGHARLAERLVTPICLDESITSLAAAAGAAELGAARVLCCKPGRLGGWPAAREVVQLAADRGLGAWVGGMLETAMGRAANAPLAAVPGNTAAPDLDPRPRYAVELAPPLEIADGWVTVPTAPGAVPPPDPKATAAHQAEHITVTA